MNTTALFWVIVAALFYAGVREWKARAYPVRRRAAYQGRIRQAETPDQVIAVAAEYLAANLRHAPKGTAWVIARAHADELTAAADALHKHVPTKEATR